MRKVLLFLSVVIFFGFAFDAPKAQATVQCPSNATPTLQVSDPACWTTYTTGYWTTTVIQCDWIPMYRCYDLSTCDENGCSIVYSKTLLTPTYLYSCSKIYDRYYNSCTGQVIYMNLTPCGNGFEDPGDAPDQTINTWNPVTVNTCYYTTVKTWSAPDYYGKVVATSLNQLSVSGTSCVSEANVKYVPINGSCGTRNTTYPYSYITWPAGSTLCNLGQPSVYPSFPASGSAVYWQCRGFNGGSTASCSASRTATPVNGTCGTRNTTYPYTTTAWPVSSTYCSSGSASASPAFPASGSSVAWNCIGANGGTSASCSARRTVTPVSGACGTRVAIYPYTVTAWPAGSTLCAMGTASPSSIVFPASGSSVSWSCLGTNGGSTVSCSASRVVMPVNGACGTRNTTYPYSTTAWPVSSTLCSSGTASPVSPIFPVSGSFVFWSCLGTNGGITAYCSASRALMPINGACGTRNTAYAYTVLTWPAGSTLCAMGTASPSSVTFPENGATATWSCLGANSGTTANCSATRANIPVNGACGTRNTTYQATTLAWPVSSTLCSSGTASPSSVTFPTFGTTNSWQCTGANGGTTANCSASRNVPLPVTVHITSNPSETAYVGQAVYWTAEVSGGIPPYTFTWSGEVSGPGTSVSQTVNYIDTLVDSKEPLEERVQVTDYIDQTDNDDVIIYVVESIPQ